MRAPIVLSLAFAACAHEPPPPAELPRAPVESAPAATEAEPPLVYAPSDSARDAIPLGAGEVGTLVDGLRAVVAGARLRTAKDVADPPLVGAHRVPAWLGGGFLFRSSTGLYAADAFDGPLRPVASFPADIDDVRFGPKWALVQGASGQRWTVDLKTGARVAPQPLGVVDVAALGDGRAAAIAEFGQVFATGDGAKWTDVTAQLQGPTDELRVVDEQLWIVAQSGASARVDPGARLAIVDKPPEAKPTSLRPKDPRWKGRETPLRRALGAGIPDGDRQAILALDGNVARVDTATGAVLWLGAGKLPADAACEPVRTADEVVFACTRGGAASFVMSHVLGDRSPTVEQSFPQGGQFYAADDGGLAFGGPCSGQRGGAVACVRGASGAWQEVAIDASPYAADGGVPSTDVARWIPRADGAAYALVLGGAMPAVWDTRTGAFRPLGGDVIPSAPASRYAHRYKNPSAGRVVDRSWSTTPTGSLRGWFEGSGVSYEVKLDGTVVVSPFHFDAAQTWGPYALARSQGRLWQSTDRGANWSEVEPPPRASAKAEIDLQACTAVGCDLGRWYRLGWPGAPPSPAADPPVAPGPARVAPVPVPMLACRQAGPPKLDASTRSEQSPEDLGLGAAKLPTAIDSSTTQYARVSFAHANINPAHGEEGSTDRDESSLRMLVSGYQTDTGSGGHFTVLGPVRDPLALRRPVAFVAPFDPASAVRRTSYGIAELVAAARGAGMSSSDVLAEDPSLPALAMPVLALDPTQPADLAFTSEAGMVGVVRSNGRVKVTMRPALQETQWLASGAWLGADELALLEIEPGGASHVSRYSQSTVTPIFDVAAPASASLYPANADAIAVSPKGDVGLLRTPSGGEPPTATSPALLYQSGQPVAALAPWSTLASADDPACKADAGWRAIVHAARSWLRLPPELTEPDARAVLRVKWSAARVCLEAVEIRAPDVKAQVLTRPGDPNEKAWSQPQAVETWVVARLAGGAQAVRAGVGPGLEWRQPLACALAP